MALWANERTIKSIISLHPLSGSRLLVKYFLSSIVKLSKSIEIILFLSKTNQPTISRIESEGRDIPLLCFYNLASDFGININWLFGLSNERYYREARVFHAKNVDKKTIRDKRLKK